jgi:hypothetical protein
MVAPSQVPLDLDFHFPEAMSLVPMDLSFTDNPVVKFYRALAFQLSPMRPTIDLVQPIDVLDTMSLGDDFDFLDLPNDLEVHFGILPFLIASSGIT